LALGVEYTSNKGIRMDMENTATDTPPIEGDPAPKGGKVRLLSLDDLDGRTRAAQHVRDTRQDVIADLGGEEQLSTLERAAVDHVALLDAMAKDVAARWLQGESVDASAVPTLVNAFNRSAAILGWRRRAKDVTPDLHDYMRTEK
jgi:hypothetical protein